MANIDVINGEQVRVNETSKGTIYSKNFRSMKDEVASAGTTDFRVNQERHSLFLGGKAYYVGPTLQGKSAAEIGALGKDIQVCDSSTDKENWIPCLFLPKVGESASFKF